jgi:hypothetical protein
MKTIKIIALLVSLISLNAIAQNPQYIYIHGHSNANTDSIMYVGSIASVDSMDFRTTLPTWTDDFNRGILGTNWTAASGVPAMNGTYIIACTSPQIGKVLYNNPLARVKPGKIFTLACDMYINNIGDNTTYPGIAFDIQDNLISYQVIRNSGGNTLQILSTDNDGTAWAGVYSNGTIPTVGKTWYRYTVTSNGINTTLHIKITKVSDNSVAWEADVTTRAIKGGKVGFICNSNIGWYDNFSFVTE